MISEKEQITISKPINFQDDTDEKSHSQDDQVISENSEKEEWNNKMEELKKNIKDAKKLKHIFKTLSVGSFSWMLAKYMLYYSHMGMTYHRGNDTWFDNSSLMERFGRKTLGIGYELMEGADDIVEYAFTDRHKIMNRIYETEAKVIHLYNGLGYQRKDIKSKGFWNVPNMRTLYDEIWIDIKDLGYFGQVLWEKGFTDQHSRNVMSLIWKSNGLVDVGVEMGKEGTFFLLDYATAGQSTGIGMGIQAFLRNIDVFSEILPDSESTLDTWIGRSKPITKPIARGVEFVGDKIIDKGKEKMMDMTNQIGNRITTTFNDFVVKFADYGWDMTKLISSSTKQVNPEKFDDYSKYSPETRRKLRKLTSFIDLYNRAVDFHQEENKQKNLKSIQNKVWKLMGYPAGQTGLKVFFPTLKNKLKGNENNKLSRSEADKIVKNTLENDQDELVQDVMKISDIINEYDKQIIQDFKSQKTPFADKVENLLGNTKDDIFSQKEMTTEPQLLNDIPDFDGNEHSQELFKKWMNLNNIPRQVRPFFQNSQMNMLGAYFEKTHPNFDLSRFLKS